MKKILFGILTFLGIGFSFCSAGVFELSNETTIRNGNSITLNVGDCVSFNYNDKSFSFVDGEFSGDFTSSTPFVYCSEFGGTLTSHNSTIYYQIFNISSLISGGGSSTPSSSDIDVYYNNGNSVENITCDGTQAISINGLSTITSTNTFTPYYNISYTDEDNQSLTESYSKDILYLENGQFKKTYTGNNDWILTYQGSSEESFTGYLPVFDVTGGINEPTESGNIFNNFAENSIKMTLSNIPSYIQYVIILMLLFFILGFIRKFRRK